MIGRIGILDEEISRIGDISFLPFPSVLSSPILSFVIHINGLLC
jgi:hypothetical protein